MRQVVLDVETTSLDTKTGRITEIGCIELYDYEPTGNEYNTYINPVILVSQESVEITGLTNKFLSKYKTFDHIMDDFLNFIGNDTLIAHNAPFDIGFLNEELKRNNKPELKNLVIDTLEMARKKYRTNNSLNGLCKRYKISISDRSKHGALLDARLLSYVYYYLIQDSSIDLGSYETKNQPKKKIEYLTDNFNKKRPIFV